MSIAPSVQTLSQYWPDEARDLREALSNARDSYEGLKAANAILEAYGIETIRSEDVWDSYFGDAVAEYVNMGDTYIPTIIYDIERDRYLATDWGTWVESYERRGGTII